MNKVGLSAWAIVAVLGAVGVTACGSPAVDTGRDKKGISGQDGQDAGSPNDPGWVPPGAQSTSPDDTVAEPGTGSEGEGTPGTPGTPGQPGGGTTGCDPTMPPIPAGLTTKTMTDFSVSAPSDWPLAYAYDKVAGGGRASVEFDTKAPPYAIANVTEFADVHSFDGYLAIVKVVAASKNGVHCALTTTPMKYGCDDAITVDVKCDGSQPSTFTGPGFAVLHGGVIYAIGCSSQDGALTAQCAAFVSSLRFTK